MRLEAAGRQARAEVQGPQTQLYRSTQRASRAVHWESCTTMFSRSHFLPLKSGCRCGSCRGRTRSAPSPIQARRGQSHLNSTLLWGITHEITARTRSCCQRTIKSARQITHSKQRSHNSSRTHNLNEMVCNG